MDKFFNWVALSSADPTAVAATVKGILTMFIPLVLIAGRYFGLNAGGIGTLPDQVESFVIFVLGIAGSAIAAAGMARKIYLSVFVK